MTRILLLAALLATPLHAGGPVIVTEEPPIADVRPQGDGGNGCARDRRRYPLSSLGAAAVWTAPDNGPEGGGNGCGC